jgi:quercetin dioxygenase-like cupin family protein
MSILRVHDRCVGVIKLREDVMKRALFMVLASGCLLTAGHWAWAQQQGTVFQSDAAKWGPASPALPKGAQQAAVVGDPTKEGGYVVRSKLPAGYKVPPHTHPNDENVTVISGTFHIGFGDKFDESKGQAIKAGGYVQAPKGVQHFAWTSEETVVQLHGVGPGGITYVNPADDPRK